jgi:hypothetical protein
LQNQVLSPKHNVKLQASEKPTTSQLHKAGKTSQNIFQSVKEKVSKILGGE